MSLIDRLGKEAQKARESRELSDRARLQLEENYQKDLQARMLALHEYLDLILAHLKEVQPPITMAYQLVGYGDLPALVMHDYKLEAQRRLLSYEITIQWRARVETKQCRELVAQGHTRIRQLIDQFRALHLGGITDIERGEGGHDFLQARFHPRGFVHIGVRALLHAHDPLLRLSFQNLDSLSTTHKQFPADIIDESLFDRIGRFLVREDNELITEELPEELRQRLRGDDKSSSLIPSARDWDATPLVVVDLDIDFDPDSVPRASSYDDPVEPVAAAPSNAKQNQRETASASGNTAQAPAPTPSSPAVKPAAADIGTDKAAAATAPPPNPPAAPLTKAQRDRELLLSASPKAPAPDDDRSALLTAEFEASEQYQSTHMGEVRKLEIQPLSMSMVDPEPKPETAKAKTSEPTASVSKESAPPRPAFTAAAGKDAIGTPAAAVYKEPAPAATPPKSTDSGAATPAASGAPGPKKPLDLAELEAKRREAEAFRDRMRRMSDKLRGE